MMGRAHRGLSFCTVRQVRLRHEAATFASGVQIPHGTLKITKSQNYMTNPFKDGDRVISTAPVTLYDPMDFIPFEIATGSEGTVECFNRTTSSGNTISGFVVRFDETKIPVIFFDTQDKPITFKLV